MSAGWPEMAVVGTVARTHGRRGEVIVNPATDFPEARFSAGSVLFAVVDDTPIELRVTGARFQRGRPIVGFAEIGTMTEAERLRGVELRVPEGALQPLPPDAYYTHDLVGCAVRTVDGREVGLVSAVEGAPGAQRLIVRHPGGEVDVPFVETICVSIDPAAGVIAIDPPAGLLELNATTGAG